MFDSDTFTQEMLTNPTLLAKTVIDAMETAESNKISIADPNNGFVMQLFVGVALANKMAEKIDHVNNFFYARRARNSEQLYSHLSEFDFTKLMASPATLPFVFDMSKDWIVANSVYFDVNYNKLQIPATSTITMNGIVYSMYYPIDIFVNRNTGAVSAIYNTDADNSLYALKSNMLLDVREYTKNGLNWFRLQFNMFEFTRTITRYTVSAQQGFTKTLNYDNAFYAVKVFYQKSDTTWQELNYSLSKKYYDYKTPTALITILNDSNKVKITIPQIYFDNNQISQTIKVELYTTRGKVNYTLSLEDVKGLKAWFDPTSSSYAAPFDQMASWNIVPTTTDVAGGSDAEDFYTVRDQIVNQGLYDRVAITPTELETAFKKAGFTPTRVIDDLTDRMYYASNILMDSNGIIIPTFCGSLLISDDALEADPSSIIKFTDGYYTIQPTTLYTVDKETLVCVPVTDGDVANLVAMTKQDRVDALNATLYVRQPFHITLKTDKKSPVSTLYNLLSPKTESLLFIEENPHSAPQMSASAVTIEHLSSGTGGYRIRFSMIRSNNIRSADITNFRTLITCQSKTGEFVYYPATYVGLDASNNDVFEIQLTTNYHITIDDHLSVMMYDTGNTLKAVDLPLTHSFKILTMFGNTFDPTVLKDSLLQSLLPPTLVSTQTVMSHQEVILTFGENMSDMIYSAVNTSWGNDVYAVADETVYYTTNIPLFQLNEDGVIETRWNTTSSAIEVVQLYAAGDVPSSTQDLVYKTAQAVTKTTSNAVLTFASTVGVLLGMTVTGTNIAVGSKVTAKTSTTVTLSLPLSDDVAIKTDVVFFNPSPLLRTSVSQTATGTTLAFADTSSLLKGMTVMGFGIQENTVISSIPTANSIVLDKPTVEIVANGTLMTFINKTSPGVVKVASGDILTDASGKAIIVKDAQNQYRIPSILFDGRLFESEAVDDINIVADLSDKIQNYANQIATLDEGLLEVSDVYYRPARSLGTATFGIGNNLTKLISLEMSFGLKVYVDEAIYNTEKTKEVMKSTIITIINTAIQNPTISLSEIADTIKSTLGEYIVGVEFTHMNNDPDLRLIALEEKGTSPCIESVLVYNSDKSVTRKPNVDIEFISTPSTIKSVVGNTL